MPLGMIYKRPRDRWLKLDAHQEQLRREPHGCKGRSDRESWRKCGLNICRSRRWLGGGQFHKAPLRYPDDFPSPTRWLPQTSDRFADRGPTRSSRAVAFNRCHPSRNEQLGFSGRTRGTLLPERTMDESLRMKRTYLPRWWTAPTIAVLGRQSQRYMCCWRRTRR